MNKIYVTQPYLPPLDEFIPYLEKIWQSKLVTNGGPFHQELEAALCKYLGVKYVSLFTNGTVALITALQALRVSGEVITTPFSFVATSHSLLWNGIQPVFVDIEPHSLNIDPAKIEAAITPSTTAIMPVHCYGHPCDVDAIQDIADRYNLRIIYDAAHAFGVECHCGSVLNHGDLSVLSFHATKVFNTFEGGAIVCQDEQSKIRIDELKNFGYAGELSVISPGINGKMSEINAAFGLVQLGHMQYILEKRKIIDARYRENLKAVSGIRCLVGAGEKFANYAYFPVLVTQDFPISRDRLNEILKDQGIFTRRYFYPLISEFSMYCGLPSSLPSNLPHAVRASKQILCLPIYPDLDLAIVDKICNIIACQ